MGGCSFITCNQNKLPAKWAIDECKVRAKKVVAGYKNDARAMVKNLAIPDGIHKKNLQNFNAESIYKFNSAA